MEESNEDKEKLKKQLFDAINRMNNLENAFAELFKFNDLSERKIQFDAEKELGEPDKVERFIENGFTFEQKVWHTPKGDYVICELVENPINIKKKPLFKEKSLEERLVDAVNDENYELAAQLKKMIDEKTI